MQAASAFEEKDVPDIIFITAIAVFAVAAIGYVRASETMKAGNAVLLVLCAVLFGYLVYALLRPEKF